MAAGDLRKDAWAKIGDPQPRDRYYDTRYNCWVIKVLPGTQFVTDKADDMLVTVLGSCVSACIRDPITGIGGMNHFMLPGKEDPDWQKASYSLRYGNHAMESLINGIVSRGVPRDRLEVKVFGGGNVAAFSQSVGDGNAQFVLDYLEAEGLKVAAADLGGNKARRIHYMPSTGKVQRKLVDMARAPVRELENREADYRKSIVDEPTAGDIELFD